MTTATRFLPSSSFPTSSFGRRRGTPLPLLTTNPTSFLLFSSSSSMVFQPLGRPASIAAISAPSRTTRFTNASNSVGDNCGWNPPLRVFDIGVEVLRTKPECVGDDHHLLVTMNMVGAEVDTEQELFDFYIKTLARVVGSEEEAKKRIYLVSCGWFYGFGAEIDIKAWPKLLGLGDVMCVCEDTNYYARNKDTNVQSTAKFTPMNWNRRLDNIFSYHHLSEPNSKWNFDHWLITIRQPDGGFAHYEHFTDTCMEMLAEVVGSEAVRKIYVIWFKIPFGFGAEIDEEASEKLRGLPNVLKVLPDFAFDIKDERRGTLHILPSFHGLRFSYYRLNKECNSEDWFSSMEEPAGSSGDYALKFGPNLSNPYMTGCWQRSDCKYWFINMEERGGEFASSQQRIDRYIQTLASVVGSKEEAKKKIYRIVCGSYLFGFCAEVDEKTSNKLTGMLGVIAVLPDYLINKCPKDDVLFINGFREMRMDLRGWEVNLNS